MANHFKTIDKNDDGAIRVIRYREILPDSHPARYIERFISGVDLTPFESRYKVGEGQVGRAPMDVRIMLGVILYGIYCRLYSARKIDHATENYSDFWFFTQGQRISHDKITEFLHLHMDDVKPIFRDTVILAHQNKLLNFEGLHIDGFFLKASASKKRSYNMTALAKKERRLAVALDEAIEQLQSETPDPALDSTKAKLEKDLLKIDSLKKKLNKKIALRAKGKEPYRAKELAEKLTINATDEDSDLMKQKDDAIANAYLQVCATDSKADIIVASAVSGHNNEPQIALPLFEQARKNCNGLGEYNTAIADSNFTTTENCHAFEQNNISLIGPTRVDDYHEKRAEEGVKPVTFAYDEAKECVHCSCGVTFTKEEQFYDKYKKTTILVFSNKAACQGCERLMQCTKNKKGYRQARIDVRRPALQRTQERYQSDEGKALYKKRSHSGETYQGDKKKNGSFSQLFHRGLIKVTSEAILQDVVWNLRRIFNATGGQLAWN
jgi:hypothetical protein